MCFVIGYCVIFVIFFIYEWELLIFNGKIFKVVEWIYMLMLGYYIVQKLDMRM